MISFTHIHCYSRFAVQRTVNSSVIYFSHIFFIFSLVTGWEIFTWNAQNLDTTIQSLQQTGQNFLRCLILRVHCMYESTSVRSMWKCAPLVFPKDHMCTHLAVACGIRWVWCDALNRWSALNAADDDGKAMFIVEIGCVCFSLPHKVYIRTRTTLSSSTCR